MKRVALLLFLHLCHARRCTIDYHDIKETMSELKLHDKIYCATNLLSNNFPELQNGTDALLVHLNFMVKSFDFDSINQEFSVFAWTSMAWDDTRMAWNVSDYDGIDETSVFSYKLIWIPGVKLINSVSDSYDHRYDYQVPCSIVSDGFISCVYWINFQVKCATDVSDWPFDKQICSLEFGTWENQKVKVRLSFGSHSVMFIGSAHGAEWDVMDYNQEVNEDAETQLKINFTLLRHADGLAAMVVHPSVVLSLLTVSSLFLDARRELRLLVAGFSLMCHLYFLTQLNEVIPEHTKNTPRVLLYFRGSLIMTSISFVFGFILKQICERQSSIPGVISMVNSFVFRTCSKVVFPRWVVAPEDEEKSGAWTDLANVMNTVWILVSVVVYFIMCLVLMPTPKSLVRTVKNVHFDFE